MPMTLLTVAVAAVLDLRTRRIPNYITFPSIALGLVLQMYYSGFRGISSSLLGTTVGVLLFFIPFALGYIGAGDVKLFGAIGAINGGVFVFYTAIYSAIAGGIIAIGYVLMRRQMTLAFAATTTLLRNIPTLWGGRHDPIAISSGIKFPYGIAILAGTIATYTLR
jgi:prepilin peptidase CpaA